MCTRPITAYWSKERNEKTGKRSITFNPKNAFDYKNGVITFNCGKCYECRLKKSKMWSLRCLHEAKFHSQRCFLTLTYNDEHLPRNNGVPTLRYKDVQDFLKRFRKYLGDKKIRYFCSAEYGSNGTIRPHYHMILYGYEPSDLKYFKRSYSGLPIYTSKTVDNIWQNGYVFIGTVTEMSAAYVARYTLEKFAEKPKEFYKFREKEAIRMSRRDGIGFKWINKYWKSVSATGVIINDGVKYGIPRFYRNFIEKINPHRFLIMKNRLIKYSKRKHEEMLKEITTSRRRLEALENYIKIKTSRLKRRLTIDKNFTVMNC